MCVKIQSENIIATKSRSTISGKDLVKFELRLKENLGNYEIVTLKFVRDLGNLSN